MNRLILGLGLAVFFAGCSTITYSRDLKLVVEPGYQATVAASGSDALGVAVLNSGPGVVDIRVMNGATNETRFASGERGAADFDEAFKLDFTNKGKEPVTLECQFTGRAGLALDLKEGRTSQLIN